MVFGSLDLRFFPMGPVYLSTLRAGCRFIPFHYYGVWFSLGSFFFFFSCGFGGVDEVHSAAFWVSSFTYSSSYSSSSRWCVRCVFTFVRTYAPLI